ncbi:Nickel import ATP-binding protein NikO [Pirellula sp. SH-Sr6A]|uniref:ABC transporter ATP-binding protein n=1 Tax=Pirellula sp. SH-Sr6A TaxID=1632865 RepID=UPI00078C0AAB|nr:ABC transporter ATP-binding protein [Pirellula sp. SH-Sr6A]AMV32697.1 Nickel import ATP-binding protein NikO [Pirellula sp. SH-Sr6A]
MTDCIVAEGLEMHFRGCDALRGVDLNVPHGSVFALLGENGAGKTTFIRILTGYQIPSSGRCTILGLNPVKDALEIRRRVGYVSDAPALYDWMRIDEIGWFASSFYPAGFLDRFRESIVRYELPSDRKIKHLSKGQRAKVALSLAVAHDPELLILDEPTSGLDPLVRREFMESMVERAASGKTVLLSSHQISEVERVADYIAILHQGKVRLVSNLASLRESVSEVTLSIHDPLTTLPLLSEPAEVLSEQKTGRQIRWVVRGWSDTLHQAVAGWPGVAGIRARPATLEEVFVACTRGSEGAKRSANALTQTSPVNAIAESISDVDSEQSDRHAS